MNGGTGMAVPSLRIELRSQRWLWMALTVVGFLFGAIMLFLGVGAFIVGFTSIAWAAAGVVLVAIAVWGLVFGSLALRLAQARPQLLFAPECLAVLHPGLLRQPLVIKRGDVEAVCIGEFVNHRPSLDVDRRSLWQRLRQNLESRSQAVRASDCLPDFSSVMGGHAPNLLVVLRRPFDLSTLPRRGLNSLAPETAPFNGPVRGARIRGVLGRVIDPEAAREALSTWGVVLERPTEEMLAWVAPAPHR